jgi:diazepam-binding inhibitor (GABA receptor modulating acyl-CoA-binding protein)
MNIHEQFNEAVANSKLLSSKPDHQTLLELYALYKQATDGDNPGCAPSTPFDIISRAKYNAWSELKGKSKENAMSEYTSWLIS